MVETMPSVQSGYRQEMMLDARRPNGIDESSDFIGSFLIQRRRRRNPARDAHWLCSWSESDSAPADQIRDVLRRNHVDYSTPAGIPRSLSAREFTTGAQTVRILKLRQMRIVNQPFQPTVVRGFSKYTRMTIRSHGKAILFRFELFERIQGLLWDRGWNMGPMIPRSRSSFGLFRCGGWPAGR